jgi:hypothetical protein
MEYVSRSPEKVNMTVTQCVRSWLQSASRANFVMRGN